MLGKVGAEYTLLHIARGQALGFCHLNIIFTGIDQEEGPIVVDADKE
jgi:hypothetical protein